MEKEIALATPDKLVRAGPGTFLNGAHFPLALDDALSGRGSGRLTLNEFRFLTLILDDAL